MEKYIWWMEEGYIQHNNSFERTMVFENIYNHPMTRYIFIDEHRNIYIESHFLYLSTLLFPPVRVFYCILQHYLQHGHVLVFDVVLCPRNELMHIHPLASDPVCNETILLANRKYYCCWYASSKLLVCWHRTDDQVPLQLEKKDCMTLHTLDESLKKGDGKLYYN